MDYKEFASSVHMSRAIDAGPQATFVPNKELPIYNWFYYKEGFSRDLVFLLIEKFGLGNDSIVLDNFCGSGTTLLACKQKGFSSIGFDVLPISVFASRVKTSDYDTERLKDAAKQLLKAKFYRIDYDYTSLMKRAFSQYALQDISLFREVIMKIEPKKTRDFFLLALINAAMKCSYAWKDGGVIKIKRHPSPPLRIMLRRVIYNMIRDIEHFEIAKAAESKEVQTDDAVLQSHDFSTITEQCDARRLDIDNDSVDAIITSPPYLNNIDYTKVYEIEQFILHEHEQPAVRSYIGLGKDVENQVLPELQLPPAAVAYFTDMSEVLGEMSRVLKTGGHAAMVVGNAYFSDIQMIVDSDIVLAYLAKKIGFFVEDIVVLNERFALEGRTQKKGILRESMIVLKKD